MAIKSYWQQFQRGRVSRRRVLSAAGVSAAGLAVAAACGGGGGDGEDEPTPGPGASAGTPVRGGRYKTGSAVNIDTLDPHISIAGGPGWFPRFYNVLVKQSAQKPEFLFFDLAEDMEVPEPGGLFRAAWRGACRRVE